MICMRRDTSAALLVVYLRFTPEWGLKVVRVRVPRGWDSGFTAVGT